jgi:hypothetical protein
MQLLASLQLIDDVVSKNQIEIRKKRQIYSRVTFPQNLAYIEIYVLL